MTSASLIISVSGLRGIVGDSLTPDVAARYAGAFACRLKAARPSDAKRPQVLIGRDGRSSGAVLRDVIGGSLRGCGCDVLDADLVATPTIGVLVRDHDADGAIQITASHNPAPYNGIKLFGRSGRVLDASAGGEVRDAYLASQFAWSAFDRFGSIDTIADPHASHIDAVLATVDVERIAERRFRVLLDSNHGSGSLLGRRLLARLGCDVVLVGGEPDGDFEHLPEPTADNLSGVAGRVAQHGCDVGFCQDPDADRLALIDAEGRYVGEEYTLALCVQRALRSAATLGPIVINMASSSMSERLATAAGVAAYRSAVGEANVADMMVEVGAAYGGEGSGGPIDPRIGYVRDSFAGMAQVLALMVETRSTLAELVDGLPALAIHKGKVDLSGIDLGECLEALAIEFEGAEVDRRDGLRLSWPDRWLLVRGSNTEPILRMIAEADDPESARSLCQRAAKLIVSRSR